MVAAFGEPAEGAITVYAVRRAAEAVADAENVLGLLGVDHPDGSDPFAPVALRPLRYGRRDPEPHTDRLLLWSGDSPEEEERVRGELAALLDSAGPGAFASLPSVWPCGRPSGAVRAAAVGSAETLPRSLRKARTVRGGRPRPVALLLPGQGSQHTGMGRGLYGRHPVFSSAVDAVLAHWGEEGDRIRADWLSDGEPAIPVDDVRRAQPLLFAMDYALAKVVLSWGVRPVALLGHSAGELVAATLSGVVPLADAVSMVRARVRAAVRIPAGGMLAVAAEEGRLRPYLRGDVGIAAVNANQQVMLAGSADELQRTGERLRADGFTVVTVPATSPFHSPAMAPASDEVERDYLGLSFREPALPLYSGYTGHLMTAEDAHSARFWARQITDTVYFRDALEELLAADDVLLVEAGPRQTLTAFARRHRAVRIGASAALALSPARAGDPEAERGALLAAAARLWEEGHELDDAALADLWHWTGPGREAAVPAASAPVTA
ncbi:acyltransferase domain-containing protein [Streptomyces durbertensis]|uniref:Acyltransferase domain-containing protein n=2 Tax=Streptomyces durbertensis TaxID=2448886 RepID=A0ABR6EFM4_9ACTN|nr:acyltransferase domain-containing protein [Streptomyces durbertensis]